MRRKCAVCENLKTFSAKRLSKTCRREPTVPFFRGTDERCRAGGPSEPCGEARLPADISEIAPGAARVSHRHRPRCPRYEQRSDNEIQLSRADHFLRSNRPRAEVL